MPNRLTKKRLQLAAIRRARGVLKRKAGDIRLAAEWAEHKQREHTLEDGLQNPAK